MKQDEAVFRLCHNQGGKSTLTNVLRATILPASLTPIGVRLE